MPYSLEEINEAVRSDPKGFAERSNAAFQKKSPSGGGEDRREPLRTPDRPSVRPARLREDHRGHDDRGRAEAAGDQHLCRFHGQLSQHHRPVLKPYVEPLFRALPPDDYPEVRDLLAGFQRIEPLDERLFPPAS